MQVQWCSSGCQRQVIFAPYLADSVGIFDPAGESCHLGTQMSSDFKFNGAAPAASGRSSSPPISLIVRASSIGVIAFLSETFAWEWEARDIEGSEVAPGPNPLTLSIVPPGGVATFNSLMLLACVAMMAGSYRKALRVAGTAQLLIVLSYFGASCGLIAGLGAASYLRYFFRLHIEFPCNDS